jgi:uncharacterized membrane protein YdjX (TVP38/TMEM64 family)
VALLILLATGIAVFCAMGGYRVFAFEHLVECKDTLIDWANTHPFLSPLAFIATYLILGLFGLPGSTVLNVTAGLLFDFWKGLLLAVLASAAASSVAFLSFRYLLKSFVYPRVHRRFPRLEETLKAEGAYFVFAIRMIPVIPFSLTNCVLAVSPVTFPAYVGASALALLPRHLLYVYAGLHLGDLQDPDDLLSAPLVAALALLALLPWVLKRALPAVRNRLITKPR